jgi:hypothetical protein
MSEIREPLEPIGTQHDFDLEVDSFVLANYEHTLRGIEQRENDALAETEDDFRDDTDGTHGVDTQIQIYYERLRVTAVHLALVRLVIRLEHWVSRFKRAIPDVPKQRPHKERKSKLGRKLDVLNDCLGKGPVQVDFFDDLAVARNSVVHADSSESWLNAFDKRAHVAKHYANDFGELKFADDNLRDAAKKAKRQVKWYDEKLYEANWKTAGAS